MSPGAGSKTAAAAQSSPETPPHATERQGFAGAGRSAPGPPLCDHGHVPRRFVVGHQKLRTLCANTGQFAVASSDQCGQGIREKRTRAMGNSEKSAPQMNEERIAARRGGLTIILTVARSGPGVLIFSRLFWPVAAISAFRREGTVEGLFRQSALVLFTRDSNSRFLRCYPIFELR